MLPTYKTPVVKVIEDEDRKRPTRTFEIDWENGRLLSKTIEGKEAIAQAVQVRTRVELLESDIMPDTFGIALKELYSDSGDPMPRDYVLANLKRIIAETLSPDLRIKKLSDFSIRPFEHHVICTMTIECEDGMIETEVKINDG